MTAEGFVVRTLTRGHIPLPLPAYGGCWIAHFLPAGGGGAEGPSGLGTAVFIEFI